MLRDPELPAAELLFSIDVNEVLDAAVASDDGFVRQATPSFVDYEPGHSIYVTYDAFVEWSNGAEHEQLVAIARADGDVRGAAVVEAAETRVGVWRVPDDPYMPGLVHAHNDEFVEGLLDDLGLAGGEITIEPVGYTPRNRSVLKVSRAPVGSQLRFVPGRGLVEPEPEPLIYLKAMRPRRAKRLREAHGVLEGVLPVPRIVADLEDISLMAFEAIPGDALFHCVVEGPHRPLDGHELVALLDRLRDAPLDRGTRMTTSEAVRFNAEIMAAVMPSQADRLARFVERFGEDQPQEKITVHGDFHENQILLGAEGLSGLLDLDDVGRGDRVDDFAMMLGRLYQLSKSWDHGRDRIAAYQESLLQAWEQYVDPRELRRRMAGVALNDAHGAFRWQFSGWRKEMVAGIAHAEQLLNEVGGPTLTSP